MPDMSFTLAVLNNDKSIIFKELQELNILDIFLTFSALEIPLKITSFKFLSK